jgi:plasmid stabilization system protein ParE
MRCRVGILCGMVGWKRGLLLLRRAVVGSHVVFFREDAAAVTVVRVLHQSMDVGM